jgi:hypothetical protein
MPVDRLPDGMIDVTLPSSTKASLRIRSDHGDVYSDFDLQPKPEPLPTVRESSSGRGRYRSAATGRSSAPSTAADPSSSCARSTAMSTFARDPDSRDHPRWMDAFPLPLACLAVDRGLSAHRYIRRAA